MGVAAAVYYPQISTREEGMRGGELGLKIPPQRHWNEIDDNRHSHEFDIETGSAVAFLNDGVHHIPLIQYDPKSTNTEPIARTVLAFFIVDRRISDHIDASDAVQGLNLDLYWRYVVRRWLRDCALLSDFEWMMESVF